MRILTAGVADFGSPGFGLALLLAEAAEGEVAPRDAASLPLPPPPLPPGPLPPGLSLALRASRRTLSFLRRAAFLASMPSPSLPRFLSSAWLSRSLSLRLATAAAPFSAALFFGFGVAAPASFSAAAFFGLGGAFVALSAFRGLEAAALPPSAFAAPSGFLPPAFPAPSACAPPSSPALVFLGLGGIAGTKSRRTFPESILAHSSHFLPQPA
mmetsp:Transcript_9737/g.22894  ORF Transcript_9737/g.22894 Transcript_9737/m.22894 type:complete len:212 (+) Transcript_9737:425-1060(+)